MIVLGIESSCDETAIALIERGERNRVIAELIKSQIPLHCEFGGVVPEIASRSHFDVIDRLLLDLLEESQIRLNQIDIFSATQGPGLIGSLLMGFMFGKTLAFSLEKPFVPIDHVDAHLDAVWIESEEIIFPALGFVVSGGHTSLYLLQNRYHRQVLAKTRDDAVGEVMDKVAKHFGLGYPGGPILDELTGKGRPGKYAFSAPKMSDGSMDFSFSGYKTAAIRSGQLHGLHREHPDFLNFIASFSHTLVDYLISQLDHFASLYSPSTIVLSGGVSRNTLLRSKTAEYFTNKGMTVRYPQPRYCTDNAAMVAWRAYDLFTTFPKLDYAQYHLTPYSRSVKSSSPKHR